MRLNLLFATALFVAGCTGMPNLPGFGGHAKKTETSSSSTTEEMNVNGQPVSLDDEDDDRHPRNQSRRRQVDDIGKTCHKNQECSAQACFTGHGNLGYCTRMCNSWSDCPSHWECKRARNAPQKICMQDD